MKPNRIFFVIALLAVVACIVLWRGSARRHTQQESRALDTVQHAVDGAKQLHEQQMQATPDAMGQPAP